MATKPTTLPIWSTDLNFSSGPEIGTPTKVEPSSGAKGQGWVPGQPLRGPRMNWWMNTVFTWLQFLDDLHNSAEFLNKSYAWSGAHTFATPTVTGNLNLQGTAEGLYTGGARTRIVRVPIWAAIKGDGANHTLNFDAVIGMKLRGNGSDGGTTYVPVVLPQGAHVVDWRAAVSPNSSPLEVSLRQVGSSTSAFGTSFVLEDGVALDGIQTATGGTGAQILSPTAFDYTVQANDQFHFAIVCGSDNTADASVRWIEVTFTETRATGHH